MKLLSAALMASLLATSVVAAATVETTRSVPAVLQKNPDKSVVYGRVVDTNTRPVPGALVRLRNLQTKAIELVMTTTSEGEFAFPALPDVPYVVELVDRPGRVLIVGDMAISHVGEFSSTVLVLPPVTPAYPGIFHATAGSIVAAVLGTGIAALESPDPPLSPEK